VIPRIAHYAHLRALDLLLPSATRGTHESPLWEMCGRTREPSNYTYGE
jgi:hypothetical protein